MKGYLCVALLSVSCLVQAEAVKIGGNDGLDACLSTGAVHGLKADGDGFLAVRSGAGTQYELLDKLKEGQLVYVCDESSSQQWLGIVYDTTGQLDCHVGSPLEPRQAYRGACKSGWVHKKWIMNMAG